MDKREKKTKKPAPGDIIEFEEYPSVGCHSCSTKWAIYVGDVSGRNDKYRKIGHKKGKKIENGIVMMTKAVTKHKIRPNHTHHGVFLVDLSDVQTEHYHVNNFNDGKMTPKPADTVVDRVLMGIGKYHGHDESLDGKLLCALARYDDDSVAEEIRTSNARCGRKTISTSHLAIGTGIGVAMGCKIGAEALLISEKDAGEESRKHRQQLIKLLRQKMD